MAKPTVKPTELLNKSKDNQLTAITNKLNRIELHLIFIVFLDEFG